MAVHLRAMELEPVDFALLHRAPPADPEPMVRAVRRLAESSSGGGRPPGFDWLLFTSRNAIPSFLDAFRDVEFSPDALLASGLRVAAVGQSTGEALTAVGLPPAEVPERYTAEDLLELLVSRGHAREGVSFLLPQAELARDVLSEGLRALGAEVVEVVAYRVAEDSRRARELVDDVARGEVEAVTLTSGRAAGVLGRAWREHGPGAWPVPVPLVGIGPVTALAAEEAGLPQVAIPEESSFQALARKVARILQRRSGKTDTEADL